MTTTAAAESALVVPVPEAEPAVGSWRERLDPSCVAGMPAHITVLFPFAAPPMIDEALVSELDELLGDISAFEFELAGVRWFDDDVVWVEPKPLEPFRRLTEMVVRRWPEFQPYSGIHPEVVPHLTVAQDCPLPEMQAAADAIATALPIPSRADRIWLMVGEQEPASWEMRAEFPLVT